MSQTQSVEPSKVMSTLYVLTDAGGLSEITPRHDAFDGLGNVDHACPISACILGTRRNAKSPRVQKLTQKLRLAALTSREARCEGL